MLGFFDNEEVEIGKKKKKTKKTDSIEMAYQYGCKVCPLQNLNNHTKCMEPSGSSIPIIYNLGEAPGKNEDLQGEPFVGKAGQLLKRNLCDVFGLDSDTLISSMRFGNVCACRPPDNRTPTDFEIACCLGRLLDDIAKTKPLMIAGYGGVPLRAMLGTDGIFAWRGRVMPIEVRGHVCWFSTHLHPAFVLRHDSSSDDTGERKERMFVDVFKRDMILMKNTLESGRTPEVVDPRTYFDGVEYIYGNNPQEDFETLKEKLEYYKGRRKVFIDIETDGNPDGLNPLNDNSMLLSLAVSTGKKTLSFPVEYEGSWGGRKYQRKVMREIKDLLMKVRIKGAHNNKFEVTWLTNRCGEEATRSGEWIDSQARAYTLDERAGGKKGEGVLSLGAITTLFLGFNIKRLSNVDRKHLAKESLENLLPYNALDAKYEYIVDTEMSEYMDDSLKWIYNHENNLGRTLAYTEIKGVPVSVPVAQRINRKLDRDIIEVVNEMQALKEVNTFEKKFSTKFMPSSTDHITKVFRDVMKLNPVKMTSKGGYSTDKEVMDVYAEQGVRLAELIVKSRELSKLKSTYVDGTLKLLFSDSRLRPDFHHLFVVTGRLSCSNPNIQNYPSRGWQKFVRSMIRAPEGYWIVTIDYSQIEARMIATIAQDKWFCDAIWNDFDIHGYWAEIIAKRLHNIDWTDSIQLKAFRKDIKTLWVFRLIYGSKLEAAENDLHARRGQLRQEYARFWDELAEVLVWQQRVLKFYDKYGYVESPLGRRRRAPLSINEQINNMIQGVASDIVTDSMNRLSYLSWKLEKPQYLPIWNIHDDLGFLIPDETLEEDIDLVTEQMCCPPFDWITVPIGVEVSVGRRWDKCEEIGKFDTRDFKELTR